MPRQAEVLLRNRVEGEHLGFGAARRRSVSVLTRVGEAHGGGSAVHGGCAFGAQCALSVRSVCVQSVSLSAVCRTRGLSARFYYTQSHAPFSRFLNILS